MKNVNQIAFDLLSHAGPLPVDFFRTRMTWHGVNTAPAVLLADLSLDPRFTISANKQTICLTVDDEDELRAMEDANAVYHEEDLLAQEDAYARAMCGG